jgi:hypothetical protein
MKAKGKKLEDFAKGPIRNAHPKECPQEGVPAFAEGGTP